MERLWGKTQVPFALLPRASFEQQPGNYSFPFLLVGLQPSSFLTILMTGIVWSSTYGRRLQLLCEKKLKRKLKKIKAWIELLDVFFFKALITLLLDIAFSGGLNLSLSRTAF